MISVLQQLLEAGELVNALNEGEDAVIHAVAEAADGVLQGISPVYATAVRTCEAVPGCGPELERLRDSIFREVAEVIGLMDIIRELVKLWRQIPSALRKTIAMAAENVAAIKGIMSGDFSAIERAAGHVLADLKRGDVIAAFASVQGWMNPAEGAISDVMHEIGLGDVYQSLKKTLPGQTELEIANALAKGDVKTAAGEIVNLANPVTAAKEFVGAIGDLFS